MLVKYNSGSTIQNSYPKNRPDFLFFPSLNPLNIRPVSPFFCPPCCFCFVHCCGRARIRDAEDWGTKLMLQIFNGKFLVFKSKR